MPIMKLDSILSRNSAKNEPYRTNTFEVDIDRISELCPLNVVSFPMANWSVSPQEKNHMNVKTKFAGKPSFEDYELVVDDTIDPDAGRIIYEWYRSVFDPNTGLMGFTNEYKSQGTVQQYDVKGGSERVWMLYGVWPNNVTFGEGNYDGDGEAVQINITFSVDYVTLE